MNVNLLRRLFLFCYGFFAPVTMLVASEYSFESIQFPGAVETIVSGINDSGDIVGTYGSNIDITQQFYQNSFGFVRKGDTWMSLQAFNSASTDTAAINNQGVVVGNYYTQGNRLHGFVFDGTSYTDIFPPFASPSGEAIVRDINDNGEIYGSFSTGTGLSMPSQAGSDFGAFRGVPDGLGGYIYEQFTFPGSDNTTGEGRNGEGIEVGSYFVNEQQFGYIAPSISFAYPHENTIATYFNNVSEQGRIVGNAITLNTSTFIAEMHSFLLDVGDFVPPGLPEPEVIDLPGPSCAIDVFGEACRRELRHINESGQIVGFYDNNDGMYLGFLGTPVPDVTVPGDYNNNAVVDAADYTVWLANLGAPAGTLLNDSTGTPISTAQYELWKANFGITASAFSSLDKVFVPEPTTAILLVFALAIRLTTRRMIVLGFDRL